MLNKINSILKANEEDLYETVLQNSLGKIDTHPISQLKGQIFTLKEISNIKEFLQELTEDEVNDDVQSSRTETIIESKEIL